MKCPFCLNHSVEPRPGKTTWPECSAEFEIDDRGECIFVDIQKMRLPVNGFVCGVCGLVQGVKEKKKREKIWFEYSTSAIPGSII